MIVVTNVLVRCSRRRHGNFIAGLGRGDVCIQKSAVACESRFVMVVFLSLDGDVSPGSPLTSNVIHDERMKQVR